MSMAVAVVLLWSVQYVLPLLLCLGHTDTYMCMYTFIRSQPQTSTALIYGHHLETERSPGSPNSPEEVGMESAASYSRWAEGREL